MSRSSRTRRSTQKPSRYHDNMREAVERLTRQARARGTFVDPPDVTCSSGKVSYASSAAAAQAADLIVRTRGRGGVERKRHQHYQCLQCGAWHLTSVGARM